MLSLGNIVNEIDHGLKALVESRERLSKGRSSVVWEAHLYPLAAGGKRVRPVLLKLVSGAFGGKPGFEAAHQVALAIELIHTYSLVHDDLPCMDNDDLRRGKPTCHKVYGEDKALLVGDGLLTLAFEVLAGSPLDSATVAQLVTRFAKAAGPSGMVAGQWLDLASEGAALSWEELVEIHTLKTGKLLALCFESGGLIGLGSSTRFAQTHQELSLLGEKLGVVFQIIDDLLDVTKTSAEIGKTARKDVAQNKATAVKILGEDGAKLAATEMTADILEHLTTLFSNVTSQDAKAYQSLLLELVSSLLKRHS